MTSAGIRKLTIGMPILSAVVAIGSVGYQYYDIARDKSELRQLQAEIRRLAPQSTENFDPDQHEAEPQSKGSEAE